MKRYATAFILSALIGAVLLVITISKFNSEDYFQPTSEYLKYGTRKQSSKKPAILSAPKSTAIYKITFDNADALKRLKQRKFSGKTNAQTKFVDGSNALHITSSNSSVLFYEEVNLDIPDGAKLQVEWKPGHYPSNKKSDYLGSKPDNDFVCQIYLLFKSGPFITSSDVMQYLMDDQYYEGQMGTSDYSDKVKLIVVDSRIQNREEKNWKTITREIRADYKLLFGKDLKYRLGGVGIMSDSDNTNSVSSAYIRSIQILSPSSRES